MPVHLVGKAFCPVVEPVCAPYDTPHRGVVVHMARVPDVRIENGDQANRDVDGSAGHSQIMVNSSSSVFMRQILCHPHSVIHHVQGTISLYILSQQLDLAQELCKSPQHLINRSPRVCKLALWTLLSAGVKLFLLQSCRYSLKD